MPELTKTEAAKQAAQEDLLKFEGNTKKRPKSTSAKTGRKPGRPKGSGKRRGPGRPKGSVKRRGPGRPKNSGRGPGRPKKRRGVGGLLEKQIQAALKAAQAKSKVRIEALVAREVKRAIKEAFS